MFLKWSISQIEHFSNGAILKSNISQMEHFSNGAILKSNISQMEHFSNEAILKSNISQMEHFSNGAFLKWSNSQIEHFSNGAILKWSILGSPPYAIFQDPKNREIWHAMCYCLVNIIAPFPSGVCVHVLHNAAGCAAGCCFITLHKVFL